jgi:hypothetical protein
MHDAASNFDRIFVRDVPGVVLRREGGSWSIAAPNRGFHG